MESKNNKFEVFFENYFGGDYGTECHNYIIKSISHEMSLQELTKNSPSVFNEKRFYLNEIESIFCN